MARKSPQYILGCVWCVSMVPCVLRNVEGGLGEQILDTEIQSPSTIHPMSPFLSSPSAKIRPWTHGMAAASEDSFEAGISVLIRGIIRLNWTKRCCPPRSANISEQSRTSTRLTLLWLNRRAESFSRDLESLAAAKIYLTGSMNWMIGLMMHWTESLYRDGKRENVAMEGWVK